MRREHAKHTGQLTRYALTQGFSASVTINGDTVTLSRAGGRGTPFLITITKRDGTSSIEYRELGAARYAFDAIKRQLEQRQ